eukprot:TRINITY_DN15288_c0_g1_i1.p1 TRINITY_DN15288_c0_g1~~TRINITY_DN15288_c0_g1_i1.p1  ORF type:complete len:101 (-),score=7.91 TRINITY_DN15288_c0_g1_i1:172-474(-)
MPKNPHKHSSLPLLCINLQQPQTITRASLVTYTLTTSSKLQSPHRTPHSLNHSLRFKIRIQTTNAHFPPKLQHLVFTYYLPSYQLPGAIIATQLLLKVRH